MNTIGIDFLRKRAQKAKNKLAGKKGMTEVIQNLKVYDNNHIEIKKIENAEQKDNELYDRLKNILDENYAVANPISYLMDQEYFDSLNIQKQEQYLFNTISKYKLLKAKYEKEKLQKAL